jgi:coproporphyrinogen III oxidase-like Fe-S oxidoreductase
VVPEEVPLLRLQLACRCRWGGAPEAAYLDALRADLEATLPLVWGRRVVSVFIGGGTPSLFSPESIDRLLATSARAAAGALAEITLEANPGTFERERFKAFRAAGVTRLSIGVQSFDDAALQRIGRVHDAAQARAAVAEAREAFDTFNIDLMYALPGQTLAQLQADLDTALSFAPPHLSIYHLTVEPTRRLPWRRPCCRTTTWPATCWTSSPTARRARAAALRGLGLRPARPPLPAQPQLLAVW